MRQVRSTRNSIVVIGGGVSGLAAGLFLAKNGFDVQLFEANNKVGGCCATTTVDGYMFNDGALFLTVIEILDDVFARLGLRLKELVRLRRITPNFSATLPDGTVVTLAEGVDVRVEGRHVNEKQVRAELQALVERWEPVLRLFSQHLVRQPFSPWKMLHKGWRHLHKFRGTLASELERSITDSAIRAALAGALLYTGLPPERAPVSTILGLIAMMTEGIYLPEGGIGRIPQLLESALKDQGGKVFLNAKVKKIEIKEGRICGLQIQGQGPVDAAAVIATPSPMSTFASLLDADAIPSVMKRKLRRTRLSHRAVSLQFGLRNTIQVRSYLNMVLPPMERQHEIFTQNPENASWLSYCVPTLTMPELARDGGSIIELFFTVPDGMSLDTWNNGTKTRITESAVRALSRWHDLYIVTARVRSPKDFMDSMNLYQGAVYGLPPSARPREQFAYRSPIPGLFLAGQCTYPGYGIAPSAMSGIFAAQALIGKSATP